MPAAVSASPARAASPVVVVPLSTVTGMSGATVGAAVTTGVAGGVVGVPVSPKFSRSLKTHDAADADGDEDDGREGGPSERHPPGAAARGRAVGSDSFDAVRDGVESIAGELLRHGSSRRVGAALSRAVGRSRASDAPASPRAPRASAAGA